MSAQIHEAPDLPVVPNFLELPDDVLGKILGYLNAKDVCAASASGKAVNRIAGSIPPNFTERVLYVAKMCHDALSEYHKGQNNSYRFSLTVHMKDRSSLSIVTPNISSQRMGKLAQLEHVDQLGLKVQPEQPVQLQVTFKNPTNQTHLVLVKQNETNQYHWIDVNQTSRNHNNLLNELNVEYESWSDSTKLLNLLHVKRYSSIPFDAKVNNDILSGEVQTIDLYGTVYDKPKLDNKVTETIRGLINIAETKLCVPSSGGALFKRRRLGLYKK